MRLTVHRLRYNDFCHFNDLNGLNDLNDFNELTNQLNYLTRNPGSCIQYQAEKCWNQEKGEYSGKGKAAHNYAAQSPIELRTSAAEKH